MNINLTFDWLPVVAVVISLAAKYIPKFNSWYSALTSATKQLVMLGTIFVLAALGSLGSYLGLVAIYPTDMGLVGYLWYPFVDFVIAVLANAGAYKATNYL